jgi:hypothetical protein
MINFFYFQRLIIPLRQRSYLLSPAIFRERLGLYLSSLSSSLSLESKEESKDGLSLSLFLPIGISSLLVVIRGILGFVRLGAFYLILAESR